MARTKKPPGRTAGMGSGRRGRARPGRSAWTPGEMKALRTLISQNTPTRVIGLKLGRTETSIYSKAAREGISLKPTNQSPYG